MRFCHTCRQRRPAESFIGTQGKQCEQCRNRKPVAYRNPVLRSKQVSIEEAYRSLVRVVLPKESTDA